jgi:hypothetical protein
LIGCGLLQQSGIGQDMRKKKTIMIWGAEAFRVAAIHKAVDLGYHVITVDYLPDNITHTFSHEHRKM